MIADGTHKTSGAIGPEMFGVAIMTLLAAGVAALVVAYLFVPHVTSRIDRFLTGGTVLPR